VQLYSNLEFEAKRFLAGTYQLIAKPLYGSGLRLIECLRLRVKDVDLVQRQIVVRGGIGAAWPSAPRWMQRFDKQNFCANIRPGDVCSRWCAWGLDPPRAQSRVERTPKKQLTEQGN
jgi:hypothetical protein